MTIFDELEKNQKRTNFYKSDEYIFYRDNSPILSTIPLFAYLNNASSTFDIVRANIIIRSIDNKRYIEREYLDAAKKRKSKMDMPDDIDHLIKDKILSLPNFIIEEKNIFVPIFPKSINRIYNTDFHRLGMEPYTRLVLNYEASVVDPFDYWGNYLYLSNFTNLIKIKDDGKSIACYHDNANAMYIINDEGRLDAKICLFDKDLGDVDKTNMVKRLIPIAEAYMSYDQDGFIDSLIKSDFYSEKMKSNILKYVKQRSK